jgi:hypothetical protein
VAGSFIVPRTETTIRRVFRGGLGSTMVEMNECREEDAGTCGLFLSEHD